MFKNLLTVKIAFLFLFVFAVAIGESAEWTWNGYFGTNYEDLTVSGSYGSFDTFVLSTISTINIDENMRLIGQIDWEHAGYFDISLSSDGSKTLNKRSSGEIALSKAYAEYSIIESLNVRQENFCSHRISEPAFLCIACISIFKNSKRICV